MLEEIGGSLIVRSDPLRAAELLAFAEATRQRLGAPVPPAEAADHTAGVERVRRELGQERLASAWAAGRGWHLDHALDVAAEAAAGVMVRAPASADTSAPILTRESWPSSNG